MYRLGIYFSDTAYQQISQMEEPDEEYHIELEYETMNEVDHFKLRYFLNETATSK